MTPSTRRLDDDARATLSGVVIGLVAGTVLALDIWLGLLVVALEVAWFARVARDPSRRAYCRRLGMTALVVILVARGPMILGTTF